LLRFELETGQADELWSPHYPDLEERVELKRIVVSDDLKLFATLSEKDRAIHVYDLESQRLLWQLPRVDAPASELRFLPASHILLVVRKLVGQDQAATKVHGELWDTETHSVQQLKFPAIENVDSWILSQDGKRLVAFQPFDRQVLVFDVETGAVESQINVVGETPVGILPQSDLLMLSGDTGELKFWDLRQDQYRATLQVFAGEVISTALLSHDKNTLVVLGKQGSLRFLGADRLRDDLADIHALMHRTPQFPDGQAAASVPSGGPSEVQGKNLPSPLNDAPQIEVLEDLPELPIRQKQPIDREEGFPLPPAPIPPAPAPDS